MPKNTLLFNLEELGCQSYYAVDAFDYLQIFFLNNEEAGNVYFFF